MPAKQRLRNTALNSQSDFVLKHRVAGAGFLLFFGALFLPWLLGAPTQIVKNFSEDKNISNNDIVSHHLELSDASDSEQDPELVQQDLDKVYISKITPLGRGEQKSILSNNDLPKVKKEVKINDSGNETTNPGASDMVNSRPASVTTSTDSLEPAENYITQAKSIEVGWAVQVGVFTDKTGAARVVEDLRTKGFNPSTSTVDTNRGKATGTRIWLGPFAQRVDAAKAKTELTSKTGEAGFIRAYP